MAYSKGIPDSMRIDRWYSYNIFVPTISFLAVSPASDGGACLISLGVLTDTIQMAVHKTGPTHVPLYGRAGHSGCKAYRDRVVSIHG
jgi:hypothetical protein